MAALNKRLKISESKPFQVPQISTSASSHKFSEVTPG